MSNAHPNIYVALNAVMKQVGYVQKQKAANSTLKYSYAGEAALIAAIRPHLVEHGIVVYPAGVRELRTETYQTSNGATMNRTIGLFDFMFYHGESDTSFLAEALGEGADIGDKSANKAMTAAYKYALRQALMIETGDDPDQHPSEDQQRKEPAKNGQLTELKAEAVNQTHWISNTKTRASFWAFASENNLSDTEVHRVLGVDSIYKYMDTKEAARARLVEYIAKRDAKTHSELDEWFEEPEGQR